MEKLIVSLGLLVIFCNCTKNNEKLNLYTECISGVNFFCSEIEEENFFTGKINDQLVCVGDEVDSYHMNFGKRQTFEGSEIDPSSSQSIESKFILDFSKYEITELEPQVSLISNVISDEEDISNIIESLFVEGKELKFKNLDSEGFVFEINLYCFEEGIDYNDYSSNTFYAPITITLTSDFGEQDDNSKMLVVKFEKQILPDFIKYEIELEVNCRLYEEQFRKGKFYGELNDGLFDVTLLVDR